jgi:hypothetical protein
LPRSCSASRSSCGARLEVKLQLTPDAPVHHSDSTCLYSEDITTSPGPPRHLTPPSPLSRSPHTSRTTATMSGIPATFWSSPIRYLRWAQHEKPAIFWSIVLGAMGPPILFAGRPFREWIGDEIPKAIPTSYPGEYTEFRVCVWWQEAGRRSSRAYEEGMVMTKRSTTRPWTS